jgi:hypothetical protein
MEGSRHLVRSAIHIWILSRTWGRGGGPLVPSDANRPLVPLTGCDDAGYSSRLMIRGLVIFFLAFGLLAPPISAQRIPAESALNLIHIPWKNLGYQIVFLPPRPGYRAMTVPSKHVIEVYARPEDSLELVAYDIAHELGHVIDLTYNTSETRTAWMKLRGIDPKRNWFGCSRCSDYNTPAGDFAETFALLLEGPKHFRGRIAPPPTAEQIKALDSFFSKQFSITL